MLKHFFSKPAIRILLGVLVVAVLATSALLLTSTRGSNPSLAHTSRLLIGPNPASPGSTVTVTGFEYPRNTALEVYFQNRANGVQRVVTNTVGFFSSSLRLPKTTSGGPAYVYVANRGTTTQTQLRFAQPSLTTTVVNKSVGSISADESSEVVQFKGEGFTANEPVRVTLSHEGAKVTKVSTATTNSQGNFTFQTPVSTTAVDEFVAVATNQFHQQVSIRLPITPSILLRPATNKVGGEVIIIGKGFKRGEKVDVSFDGIIVATATANKHKWFITKFRVPLSAQPGFSTVTAVGRQSGNSASATFVVQSPPLFVTLTPNSGSSDQIVIVTGSGFTPLGPVQIRFDDPAPFVSSIGVLVATTTTSPSGTFRTSFAVPRGLIRGSLHYVIVIDVATGRYIFVPFRVL